ncbi:MAG: large conductance mechanosensitive channel protein MscL [Chitinophagia bacterium]|nr:large conductance mechanosensitive channel protein MscL [Chitinophagia bacterium]
MSLISDFKSFALKGNVMDLAVGVIIGAAFGKIVSSLVEDILMPIVGIIAPGGQIFADRYLVLKAAKEGDVYHSLDEAKKAGANIFAYGHFLQTVFDFLIIAFCIFLIVKGIEQFRRKQEAAPAPPPAPSSTEVLLAEIRDELRKK